MEEATQVLLIQIVAISIIVVILLQVVLLFFASIKRQINSNKIFEMEWSLLQNKIGQQLLEANLIQQKNDNIWLGFRKFTIQKKEYEQKSGICSFYLIPHDGKAIPSFNPGQHLFFRVNVPGQKKPLLRCYSISSSPFIKEYYRISIKKSLQPVDQPMVSPGIVSSYFYDHLKQGDIVDVRAPSGHFFIDLLSYKPVVLIAAGIGITPLLSMLNAICDAGAQRETWFFLGVKNKQNHIMQEHLKQIDAEFENIHIHTCYSQPRDGDIKGWDYDYAKHVSVDLLKKYLPNNNFEFYFCGPAAMIDSFTVDLTEWGVPLKSQHYEQFEKPEIQKKQTAIEVDKPTATIKLSKTNKSFAWSDSGDSILDLALSNGANIDYSCRRGMCGLCQTTIKSGNVYYDEEPEYLPDLEQGMCLPCVAKTKQGLELYA